METLIKKFNELKKEYPELSSYELKFGNAVKTLGSCNMTYKIITISNHHIKGSKSIESMNTLLHEIAHALAYHRYKDTGHGEGWKKMCLLVGARPKRCSTKAYEIERPKAKFIGYCKRCGSEHTYNIRKNLACGICYEKGIISKIEYRRNEE